MKSIDNKKARDFGEQGLIDVITKDVNNMSNITQFSTDKQIMVSEHQLRRLLEFVNITEQKLLEVQTLIRVIAEKSDAHSTAKTLAHIASSIAMGYREECGEELEFFKENSPQLVSTFSEELVA